MSTVVSWVGLLFADFGKEASNARHRFCVQETLGIVGRGNFRVKGTLAREGWDEPSHCTVSCPVRVAFPSPAFYPAETTLLGYINSPFKSVRNVLVSLGYTEYISLK